jgi:hypothetical protein
MNDGRQFSSPRKSKWILAPLTMTGGKCIQNAVTPAVRTRITAHPKH